MNERVEAFMRGFPAQDLLIEMTPEEIGVVILGHLKRPHAEHHRYNFMSSIPRGPVFNQFMEGWGWLEREGLIATDISDQFGSKIFVTRKGKALQASEDYAAYKNASFFPSDLDAELMRSVKPLFIRGDYDTAVFRAFKEVEVRVRKRSGLSREDIGNRLMKKAFGPPGFLATAEGHSSDQDSLRDLFCGAISFCKNPSSHHEVQFENPREVVDMICFANQLLRIVDRLVPKV